MSTVSAWGSPEPELIGQSVRLSALTLEDAAELWAAHAPGTTARFVEPLDTPAARDRFIAAALADRAAGLALVWTVRNARDDQVIGTSRFGALAPAHRRAEIGWTWFTPHVQGGPANPETKLLMLDYGFDVLQCRRVEFKTDARNARSRAALLGIGATEEGTLRRHMILADGSSRDSVYFSIIAEEWPEIRAALLSRILAKRRAD